jgi:GxxExxY protein
MKMDQELIDIAKTIYESVGPGYSESVYHRAFEVCLREKCILYETERILPIKFHDHVIGSLRADLIVDNACIIELKAVSKLSESAKIQTKNYIKLTGISRALLINFPHESDVLVPQVLRFGDWSNHE